MIHLIWSSLQWLHNERDGVSNDRRLECLLNRFLWRRSKKRSKLRVTGLCEGNPAVTGGISSQSSSKAGIVFIWWSHHGVYSFFDRIIDAFVNRLSKTSRVYLQNIIRHAFRCLM